MFVIFAADRRAPLAPTTMTDQTLRARSVSELVDATFSLYRRDASAYIMVTAIASVPGLIAQLILLGQQRQFTLLGSFSFVIVTIVSTVTFALMSGVVMKVGSDVYQGGDADVAGAVRHVRPLVGTLVAVALMRGILLVLGIFPGMGIGVLYVLARWFAPEAAVVLEGSSSIQAFSRASALSEGRRWHIVGALALGYSIYFLLAGALGIAIAAVRNDVVSLVIQNLYTIVAYPVVGLLTMLVYYDARIRAEGFDVEHMARTLGTSPAGPGQP